MPEPDAGDATSGTTGIGRGRSAAGATGGGRPGRRVLIVTAGGGGDVAPYTGLGVRLRDAGFDVSVATHAPYGPTVTASGLAFHPLPGDPRAWLHDGRAGAGGSARPGGASATRAAGDTGRTDGGSDGGGAGSAGRAGGRGGPAGPGGDGDEPGAAVLGKIQDAHRETGAAIVAAAEAGTDLMLLGALAVPLGYQVAEALRVPSMGVHLQPTEPTREFPSVFVATSLGRWGNRASTKVAGALFDVWLSGGVKQLRTDLGLPPLSLRAMQKRMRLDAWPIHCGFSEAVIPRPADWRPGIEVVGYWWPDHPGGWQPPPELTEFLAAGPPPVFVGFGSLGTEGRRLGELVPAALRKAGVRGVIQAGWAGMAAAGDDMLSIGEAPHELLFPHMAAVVHAAGAGVVAAGLRAGVPAVPVPVGLDQPFWGQRLVSLGVAPDSIPFKKLTVDRLATAVRAVVDDPAFGEAAAALGERVRAEDGAGTTVAAVRAILGVPADSPPPGATAAAPTAVGEEAGRAGPRA
jgi:sterol 3beta-glucosyltransferase